MVVISITGSKSNRWKRKAKSKTEKKKRVVQARVKV